MKDPTKRIFTISNLLTFSRLVLTIPLVWMLEIGNMRATLVLIGVTISTDILDGFVARRTHQITNLGKLLDPIADKFLMLGVMIFLIMDPDRRFPLAFLILEGARDISVSIIAVYIMSRRHQVLQSNWPGKASISVTAVAMFLYVIHATEFGAWVLAVAAVLLIISWIDYLIRYRKQFRLMGQVSMRNGAQDSSRTPSMKTP